MQLITLAVILQLVVETDLAAAVIHLVTRDRVNKEHVNNQGLPAERTG